MGRMELKDVYRAKVAPKVLYALLSERGPRVNISHRKLPTYPKHLAFLRSKPYKKWYLISIGKKEYAGAIYLSKNNETGIFIFKKFRGKGYGRQAVRLLMRKHKEVDRFLVNVNPLNECSIRFFRRFKFKHIQNTYEFIR